jgi:hypothetical protein
MGIQFFTSISAAMRKIANDNKIRDGRVRRAVGKAAAKTAIVVRRDIAPRAFGELAGSIYSVDHNNGIAEVVADAPYAEAVERGSRPHLPPLAPIVKWVRLRGLQGITKKGTVRQNLRLPSNKMGAQEIGTRYARTQIGHLIQKAVGGSKRASAKWRANAELGAVDPATIAVAEAIRHKIAVNGTKPFFYMRAGIPTAHAALDSLVKQALKKPMFGE